MQNGRQILTSLISEQIARHEYLNPLQQNFTQGKPITVAGLELYGKDANNHHAAGDKDAATSDLADQGQFTFTAGPDAPGPTQVLTRAAGSQAFLLVRYSL